MDGLNNFEFVTEIEMSVNSSRIIHGTFTGEKFRKEYFAFAKKYGQRQDKFEIFSTSSSTTDNYIYIGAIAPYDDVDITFDESNTQYAEILIHDSTGNYSPSITIKAPWNYVTDRASGLFTFMDYIYKKYIIDQFATNAAAAPKNKMPFLSKEISNVNIGYDENKIKDAFNGFTATATIKADNIDSNTIISNAYTTNTTAVPNNNWTTTTTGSAYTYTIPNNLSNITDKGVYIGGWDIGDELNKANPIEKGKKSMKNFINFDFGPIKNDNVHLSMYGVAIRNKEGRWVAYDNANESIIDVEIMNFTGTNMLYKMPVGLDNVNVGDVIVHGNVPMFVTQINLFNGGKIQSFTAIDPYAGEQKIILPTKNMFNFNFVTKIVSLMDMCGGLKADESNPFGNILPFMMMDESDFDPMMFMFMMNGNDDKINQNMLMMLALSNKNEMNDMLPILMLMNSNK